MVQETVRVCQDNHSWQAQLNPAGTTIGRSDECDIVIDSKHVSRHHARIFSSPDGQWYVEDLGSSNGTFVNGEHVKSCPISRADVIEIGMATLSFSPLVEQATLHCIEAPNIIIEDFGTEVFYDKPRLEDCEQQPCPERLKQMSRCLSEIAASEAVYSEVCRLLTQDPKTAAAVFRVPSAAVTTLATP
ncbi:MAG: FHA domain-containing protein, partial [Planctomycetota bacterium]